MSMISQFRRPTPDPEDWHISPHDIEIPLKVRMGFGANARKNE